MMKFTAKLTSFAFATTSALAAGESAVTIDTNGDGVVTVDEMQAVFPDVSAETFAALDVNNDGALDDSEMVAGQEQGLIPASTDG